MHARTLVLASALAGAFTISFLAACVGDDPVPTTTLSPTPDAAASTPDASPGFDAAPADAADEAQAEAGAFTPAALDADGKLAVWLEASTDQLVISNGMVSTWKDRSKNHNDATNSQAGPTQQTGAINGHDAVRFDSYGLTLTMADAASLQFGRDGFYIVAVAKSLSDTGTFWSKVTTQVTGGGVTYSTGLELVVKKGQDAGTQLFPEAYISGLDGNTIDWLDPVFDDTKFHLIALRRVNQFTLAMQVDDQTPRTASTGAFDVSEPGKDARVGAVKYGNFNKTTDFWIAEEIIVHDAKSGAVADADVANLRAYLKTKYGL